jgi:hypothetical protein
MSSSVEEPTPRNKTFPLSDAEEAVIEILRGEWEMRNFRLTVRRDLIGQWHFAIDNKDEGRSLAGIGPTFHEAFDDYCRNVVRTVDKGVAGPEWD